MKKGILLVMILCLLCTPCFAVENVDQQQEQLVQELPSEAAELMEDISPGEDLDFAQSLVALLNRAVNRCTVYIREGLSLCALLLGIVLLCSVCITPSANQGLRQCLGAVGIFVAVTASVRSMILLSEQTIQDLRTYSGILLPIMSSTLAISGAPATAAGLHGGTVLFANLLMGALSKLIFPCVYLFLALGAAESALSSSLLGEMRSFIGWIIEKSMRVIMYAFTAYISLTGIISGNVDAVAIKATKAAVSGMVPVVGGILSDASEAMLAGASVVKSSVGVFGLIAVLGIVILPFLRVGFQYILMKCTAACAGAVGMSGHVNYLKQISTAMGYVLAMTGVCALLLLVSVVCYLKVASI